jgi:S1-C subfamily serine protease
MWLSVLLLAATASTANAGELATVPDSFAESAPEVNPPRDEAPQAPAPRLAPQAAPQAPPQVPPEVPPQAAPGVAPPARGAAAPVAVDPRSQLDTVVQVRTSAVAGGETIASLGARRSGSGVILDPSTVLTIGYLLLEADEVEIVTASGRRIPGSVAGYDHQSGFGVVRAALPLDGSPLELGDSDRVTERQKVLTLGHGESEATELIVVSRKPFAGSWEYLLDKAIFTFPPVNNWSGAALLSEDGKLVGIGSLIVNDAASDQPGVPGNMFVPVNLVKPILADLLSKGRRDGPPQAWLGLSTESVRGNLMVARVTRGSPAEQAGLAPGDIIVGVGDAGIGDQAEFYRRVWKSGPAGTIVKLRVLQGGSLREVPVQSMDRADFLRKPSGI